MLIVFAFAICRWQANGTAPHSPIIRHLPIRFSELANTPHSPVANAEANAMSCHWPANGKWRMIGEGQALPFCRSKMANGLPFRFLKREFCNFWRGALPAEHRPNGKSGSIRPLQSLFSTSTLLILRQFGRTKKPSILIFLLGKY